MRTFLGSACCSRCGGSDSNCYVCNEHEETNEKEHTPRLHKRGSKRSDTQPNPEPPMGITPSGTTGREKEEGEEMSLSHIPTPETDAVWEDCEDSYGNPMVAVDVDFARDLERRLTVARETLERITIWSTENSVISISKQAITRTAPKQ